jgi:glycosyltransferase involved in cell wall biosynthesis
MRVLIVNTSDRGGGAERMSMRLLRGLLERDVDAWLTVGVKATDHPRVVPIGASPHVRPPRPRAQALWDARRRLDARRGREDFAFPSTRGLLDVAGERPDVVLAVNLHGGYFDLRRLPGVTAETPVVAKLADSWLFTGHCAVPAGCERWRSGCGRCPDLATPPAVERDRTAANWRRKRRLMERSRLTVTAPSRWMLDRARQSLLAPAIEAAEVVPNGVDLDVFAPGPSAPGRERLGIGAGARVLVFVAHGGLSNPYKDGSLVLEAARRVADLQGPLELIVVGGERRVEAVHGGLTIREVPYLRSAERLADVYRAADLYVHAAREETFCITAAEALACGVPVVAAAGGGLREVVRHGATGLVSEPGALEPFADGIERLLADGGERRRMGAAATADARARFDAERMVDSYLDVCSRAVQRASAARVA